MNNLLRWLAEKPGRSARITTQQADVYSVELRESGWPPLVFRRDFHAEGTAQTHFMIESAVTDFESR